MEDSIDSRGDSADGRPSIVDDHRPALRISGVVGWGFSGFFPVFDEFFLAGDEIFGGTSHCEENEQYVWNEWCSETSSEWSDYGEALMTTLEELGVHTPRKRS